MNTGVDGGVSGSMLPAVLSVPVAPPVVAEAVLIEPPTSDPGWYQGATVPGDGQGGQARGCSWALFRALHAGAALQLVALVEPSGIGGWLWTVPIAGLEGSVGSGATALQAMDLACSALVRAAAAPRAVRNDRHALRLLERWRSGGPKQQGPSQPAVRLW